MNLKLLAYCVATCYIFAYCIAACYIFIHILCWKVNFVIIMSKM